MPVVGIGGYFFRAQNPAALKAWYRENLGVGGGIGADPETGHSNEYAWYHEGGPMVFEPFAADTDYFADDKQAMINLRGARPRRLACQAARSGGERSRRSRKWKASDALPGCTIPRLTRSSYGSRPPPDGRLPRVQSCPSILLGAADPEITRAPRR
jgi:hypothetical protein